MKKILPAAFLVFLFTNSFSQKGFHIGVAATGNSTWILNQNNFYNLSPFTTPIIQHSEMDYRLKWGWNAGLALGYNFTTNWGLQLECLYNQTGQKYEDHFDGPAIIYVPDTIKFKAGAYNVGVTRNVTIDYVQLPLMAKYTSRKLNIARAYAMLGVQVGFRTKVKEAMTFNGYAYNPPSPISSEKKFKLVDFGVAIRGGVNLYATDNLYFNLGISLYGSVLDINGKELKETDWYSKNDNEYQKSYNFRSGLEAGIHYVIRKNMEYYER